MARTWQVKNAHRIWIFEGSDHLDWNGSWV